MHQTFYIDVDEEITSVIDRLRKSKTKENIFVVPKSALILQSIVNLRVLKKEADKFKKQIMIVTQDELGRSLADRIGILSQISLEGVEENDELKVEIKPMIKGEKEEVSDNKEKNKKILESIGSDDFFAKGDDSIDSAAFSNQEKMIDKIEKEDDKKSNKDKEAAEKKSKRPMSDILKSEPSSIVPPDRIKSPVANEKKEPETNPGEIKSYAEYDRELDPKKEKELNELFQKSLNNKKREMKKEQEQVVQEIDTPVSGKMKKFFILFGSVSIVASVLVGMYLLLPKAEINIALSSKTQSVDMEISGDSNVTVSDIDGKTIPSRLIVREKEKSISFNASGKLNISDQKARGKVIIYNEYDTSSQPLVATTRLLTLDGKLFRLVKGVTVPGMTNISGKLEPGAIEAEVVADSPGEEFNIGSTKFSIPGLEGSLKYDKFYAKSTTSMAGGGSSGDEVTVISGQDTAMAKIEVEKELRNETQEEIRSELQNGEVFMKDNMEIFDMELVLPEEGSIADTFEVKLKAKVRVMVFSENELRKIVENEFSKSENENIIKTVMDYGESTSDFEKGVISVRVYGKALIDPELDQQKLKTDLLGKSGGQLEEVLGNYPEISEMEIEFWPEFLPGKVPNYGKRVEISIIPSDF